LIEEEEEEEEEGGAILFFPFFPFSLRCYSIIIAVIINNTTFLFWQIYSTHQRQDEELLFVHCLRAEE